MNYSVIATSSSHSIYGTTDHRFQTENIGSPLLSECQYCETLTIVWTCCIKILLSFVHSLIHLYMRSFVVQSIIEYSMNYSSLFLFFAAFHPSACFLTSIYWICFIQLSILSLTKTYPSYLFINLISINVRHVCIPIYSNESCRGTNKASPLATHEFSEPGRYTVLVTLYPPVSTHARTNHSYDTDLYLYTIWYLELQFKLFLYFMAHMILS